MQLRVINGMAEVLITDSRGIPCLDAANWVEFSLVGDGRLLDNQGTSTGSRKIQAANGCARIKVSGEGKYVIAAKSPDLPTAFFCPSRP